ncbi:MAG: hypothetical protein IKY46_06575, partial [Clostridia bacterium]|nr:hypothetical protein [Clostridia bacterium]
VGHSAALFPYLGEGLMALSREHSQRESQERTGFCADFVHIQRTTALTVLFVRRCRGSAVDGRKVCKTKTNQALFNSSINALTFV